MRSAKLTCWSALLGCLVLFSSCSNETVDEEPLIRPVRYQPVYSTGGKRVRSFSGVAQAGIESILSFKVRGTIQQLPIKVGESVSAGQAIASLDPTDYRIQVQEAEATHEQAQAQERNAAASYERTRGLYENRNATKNDLDQARSGAESAEAQVTAASKRLQLARMQLNYTELKAPVSGAIAELYVDVNENVGVGNRVAKITSGSRLEVVVAVPSILISQLREGDQVEVSFDALPDVPCQATITEVGVASTALVTTFPVTVLLEKQQESIRPGMAAEVTFIFESGSSRERFIVPPVAVGEDRTGRYVLVAKPTEQQLGLIERRPVEVGELTSAGLEVFEGLFEGDLLVTAGVSKLGPGDTVRLTGAKEQPR